ncbi:MAG: PorP/SprF family type IX secretion system membrane protein [Bacteroidota bacterium]
MKKYTLIIIILFAGIQVFAQQLPLRSQYMLDYFTLNPAVAGSLDHTPINLSVRQQWVGFEGAPSSQSINAHTYIGNNIGMGGALFNEIAGPSRRTGASVSFAYHIQLSKDFSRKLSFGLSPVFYQHYINTEMLTTDMEGDPVIENGFETKLSPDANFGIMFSEKKTYFVGLSVFNLLELRTDLFKEMDNNNNPVKRTFYLTGGYTFNLSDDFDLQPSSHIQYQMNTPVQAEGAIRGTYKDLIGLGVSYRYLDAVAYMLTINLGTIRIGYSYDMTTSNLKNHAFGSHEFHLTYRIFNNKNTKSSTTKIPMFY